VTVLVWLIPIALAMAAIALVAFLWSMRSGQYDDLDGAAERVLLDQEEDRPISDEGHDGKRDS
jgi:cbb3-type cytochrome oxidase maturation protein